MSEKLVFGVCASCGENTIGFRDGMNNLVCAGCAYGLKRGTRTLYTVDQDGNLRAPSVFCLPEVVA